MEWKKILLKGKSYAVAFNHTNTLSYSLLALGRNWEIYTFCCQPNIIGALLSYTTNLQNKSVEVVSVRNLSCSTTVYIQWGQWLKGMRLVITSCWPPAMRVYFLSWLCRYPPVSTWRSLILWSCLQVFPLPSISSLIIKRKEITNPTIILKEGKGINQNIVNTHFQKSPVSELWSSPKQLTCNFFNG